MLPISSDCSTCIEQNKKTKQNKSKTKKQSDWGKDFKWNGKKWKCFPIKKEKRTGFFGAFVFRM